MDVREDVWFYKNTVYMSSMSAQPIYFLFCSVYSVLYNTDLIASSLEQHKELFSV